MIKPNGSLPILTYHHAESVTSQSFCGGCRKDKRMTEKQHKWRVEYATIEMLKEEIKKLAKENEQLKKANSALSYAYIKLVSEYSLMLSAIEKHSENIKRIVEGLKSPE